ncbi:MAG: prolyl oligopeptidase family serine peptidase, partial [Verrucomicrobia bacterium]|nr:prolyl oligopeptidase family serine peptidase [Verrucomicrobiota bacterium]
MRTFLRKSLAVLSIVFLSLSLFSEEGFVDSATWYERMRIPWTRAEEGFLREWLIIGEFPNPPHEGDEFYDHTPPCKGFDTDYLLEHGGEAEIIPGPRLTHFRPDGSEAEWVNYVSDSDIVDFIMAIPGRPSDNAVAYAYTLIRRDEAGPGCLAIGSDDGVQVIFNGKVVHENLVGRGVTLDDDIVFVDFEKGVNSLLLKVENGEYGWGFSCRILKPDQVDEVARRTFSPSVLSDLGESPLVVGSDEVENPKQSVAITVLGPGGEILAQRDAVRGAKTSFDVGKWPEGPFEIRCTLVQPTGERMVRHLGWFKGDLQGQVEDLLSAAEQSDPQTERGMILRMLAGLVKNRLGEKPANADTGDVFKIHSALLEFCDLQAEQEGSSSRVRPYGFVRLAYRDEVDGSPQFARLYLPADYDPSKKYPLVIYLHGYNPDNPEYIHWWAVDQRHSDRAEKYGVIYLEPHGRGNTWYTGIGEQDVLRTIAMTRELVSVDPSRIYLTGESMGGGGTWHVGTRNPGLFAAIAPVYGGWDYRASMLDGDLKELSDWEKFRDEAGSSVVQAEALLTTPVFVNHGDADDIVNVNWSRFFVRELQRWNYDIRYREMPGEGHFGGPHWPGVFEWLLKHTRVEHPKHVRVRAAHLKTASAHWVAVRKRRDPMSMMHV